MKKQRSRKLDMDTKDSLDGGRRQIHTTREVSMVSGIPHGRARRHRHIKRYLARTQCLLVFIDAHLDIQPSGAMLVLPFLLSRRGDGKVL
jgi:hypothetical protein